MKRFTSGLTIALLSITLVLPASSARASSTIEKAARTTAGTGKSAGNVNVPPATQEKEEPSPNQKTDSKPAETSSSPSKSLNTEKPVENGLIPFSTKGDISGYAEQDSSLVPPGSQSGIQAFDQTSDTVGYLDGGPITPFTYDQQFIGMGEELPGNNEPSDSSGEASPEESAPMTTEELLAIQENDLGNVNSQARAQIINSLDQAIEKWRTFSKKGGSGAGVVKRLEALKQKILSEPSDDIKNDSQPDDESDTSAGNSSSGQETDSVSNENNGEEDPSGNDTTNDTHPSDDSGLTTDNPADPDQESFNEDDEPTDDSGMSFDDDDASPDEAQPDTENPNSRDNLAPTCSFTADVSKSGVKNGTVLLRGINYFDKADPRTNIASGAKKVRFSNDGLTWQEYPADQQTLRNLQWKFGTPDSQGNVTVFMQACDNEGNWGNGESETFSTSFNVGK